MPRHALLSAPAGALALLLLAGCSAGEGESGDTTSADCTPTASGAVVESIELSAEPGTDPAATFDALGSFETTQVAVTAQGDGATLADGDLVDLDFTVYDGTTGEAVSSTGHGEGTDTVLTVDDASLLQGLYLSLICQNVGDRVVAAIPSGEAFGSTGSTTLGIAADTPLVFVADVLDVVPTEASGEEQEPTDGFPTVEIGDDGTPTVTIPDADPPTDLEVAVLIQGDGTEVQAGDEVTMQYVGVNWTTGEVFDQSWGSGPRSFTTDAVITGFGDALVGQQVGSRIIAIIPPDQGYGPSGGNDTAGIAEDDTIVFVIDILRTSGVVG